MRLSGDKKMARNILWYVGCIVFLAAAFLFLSGSFEEKAPLVPASVSGSTQLGIDLATTELAVKNNLDALGLTTGSGLGQTIAIVDTGIDPATFSVSASDGRIRLLDWIDLSSEGVSAVMGKYSAESGYINIQENKLKVGSGKSLSNSYMVGTLPRAISSRLDSSRTVYFVVGDPNTKGIYDSVWIDTDSDLSIEDEVRLGKYAIRPNFARITLRDGNVVSIVVSDISQNGARVVFGFDLNGHGTSLASIACGTKSYKGVATDADVITIKVMGAEGNGEWSNIVQGIRTAASAGAGVILVGSVPEQVILDSSWEHLQEELYVKGIHLVMPVGNRGPGAGTVTATSYTDSLILASGYYPHVTTSTLLGTLYTSDVWYPYSSCGPDARANTGPSFMAPAIASVPKVGTESFGLMDGTSVSAAYAAGAVAVLRESFGTTLTGQMVTNISRSIAYGADPIADLLPVEQGAGRLRINKAQEFLKQSLAPTRLVMVRKWDGETDSSGVWVKEYSPAAMPIWVDSFLTTDRKVDLISDAPWLSFKSQYLELQPVSQRSTMLYGEKSLKHGFYSTEVLADDPSTPGVDDSLTVSVSIPRRFGIDGKMNFEVTVDETHRLERQFIKVPQSAESMSISLASLSQGMKYAIYAPDGFLVREGTVGEDSPTRIGLPAPGLWQVCVYYIGSYDIEPAVVNVRVNLEGVVMTDLGATTETHYFLINSNQDIELVHSASSESLEWRERRSFTQPTNRSMQVSLPAIDESVSAISIKSGAVTGSYIRVYLYRFDELSGIWTEVGRSLTTSTGVGELYMPNPIPGQYIVYLEAYGVKPMCHVELDAVVLRSGEDIPAVNIKSGTLHQGASTIQVDPRRVPMEPELIVARRKSDGKVVGVVERALLEPDRVPLVQVMGTSDIKTIRAWEPASMTPLDLLVTVGNAAYQLGDGRVTANVSKETHLGLITDEGFRFLTYQD
jgi:hypothetical protein